MLLLSRKIGEVIRIGDHLAVEYAGRDGRGAIFSITQTKRNGRSRTWELAVPFKEKGFINDDVYLVPTEIKVGQVRVGVEAPREVAIHRQEVYERIQLEVSDAHRHT